MILINTMLFLILYFRNILYSLDIQIYLYKVWWYHFMSLHGFILHISDRWWVVLFFFEFVHLHLGVSKNNGTPKSSILIGFSRWWFQTFFYFHPYLGKIPILTNIFQMGWNHQLVFHYKPSILVFSHYFWKHPFIFEEYFLSCLVFCFRWGDSTCFLKKIALPKTNSKSP